MDGNKSKESKRELITEAAIQVFSRKGYHHSKMEEIAVEAGIGKGTIYEYFPSKLQLLRDIMEQSYRLYDHTLHLTLAESTLEDKLEALIRGHLQFCQDNKDLTRILFLDTDVIDEELRQWAWQKKVQKEQYLQEMFAEAIRRGEIKPMDDRLLTIVIGGILMSFWGPIVMENWQVDPGVAAHQVNNMIMRGIKRDPMLD
ncbi:MAG: TetR/AcrR family transcriptional regulator [Syntrophomonadaceae bacterium]|nr:TetR/AcrR family transcriptional regulator [Syntrophomonadaceae bacterium]